jgi:hypothetical protein
VYGSRTTSVEGLEIFLKGVLDFEIVHVPVAGYKSRCIKVYGSSKNNDEQHHDN